MKPPRMDMICGEDSIITHCVEHDNGNLRVDSSSPALVTDRHEQNRIVNSSFSIFIVQKYNSFANYTQ